MWWFYTTLELITVAFIPLLSFSFFRNSWLNSMQKWKWANDVWCCDALFWRNFIRNKWKKNKQMKWEGGEEKADRWLIDFSVWINWKYIYFVQNLHCKWYDGDDNNNDKGDKRSSIKWNFWTSSCSTCTFSFVSNRSTFQ